MQIKPKPATDFHGPSVDVTGTADELVALVCKYDKADAIEPDRFAFLVDEAVGELVHDHIEKDWQDYEVDSDEEFEVEIRCRFGTMHFETHIWTTFPEGKQ